MSYIRNALDFDVLCQQIPNGCILNDGSKRQLLNTTRGFEVGGSVFFLPDLFYLLHSRPKMR